MTFLSGTALACQRKTPLLKNKYTPSVSQTPARETPRPMKHAFLSGSSLKTEVFRDAPLKNSENARNLLKIRRTPLRPLALFTFRHVFNFAVLKEGLHFDLAPAGTKKLLGGAGSTRVFTGLSHSLSPSPK
jgi:hypothetical protein